MLKYIALLRGINVSGKNKILMADLQTLFKQLGFLNIATYIQSGNVVFHSSITDKSMLASMITDAIKKEYDYEVPVMIRTADEIQAIVSNNPFLNKETDTKKLYVVFLNTKPIDINSLDAFDIGEDTYQIINDTMYIKYVHGAGKTKLSVALIERKLQLKATARNWRTSNKLAVM